MNKEESERFHKKFVDDGLFDAIEQSEYAPGDIVAVRASPIVHGVLEVRGAFLLLDDGQRHYEVARSDIRPGSEYVMAIRKIVAPDVDMAMDRHGHGYTLRDVRFIHDEWE